MTNPQKPTLVVGGFSSPLNASHVYHWLIERGYDDSDVSVILSEDRVDDFREDLSHQGDGTHTVTGMAIGATVGATAATLAALTVPGLNLIALGGLLAAMGGASAGTLTGGLIGGMVDLTLPEQTLNTVREVVNRGGVVLIVNPHKGDEDAIRRSFAEAEMAVVGVPD